MQASWIRSIRTSTDGQLLRLFEERYKDLVLTRLEHGNRDWTLKGYRRIVSGEVVEDIATLLYMRGIKVENYKEFVLREAYEQTPEPKTN